MHLALRRLLSCAALTSALALTGCPKGPVEVLFEQPLGSPSHSTPALGKKAIAFGTESGNVFYYGRDGRFLAKFQAIKEVVGAPAYDEETDTFVFGSTSYVFYATSGLGKQRWSVATRDRIKGDPIIDSGRVYFGSYDDHFYCVDLKSSRKHWIFPTRGLPAEAEPEAEAAEGEEAAEGAEAPAAPAPKIDTGDFSYSKPFLHEGVLYVGNMDGHLYALDAKSGEMKWRYKTGGAVTSSPWVEGDVVYFGSNDNLLHAIKTDGKTKVFEHKTGGWVNASPVVHEGVLYCGSDDGKLYALDPATGAQKWAFDTGGEIKSRPAFHGDKVIITSGARASGAWIINRADGTLFHRHETAGKVESDPVVENGVLFLTTGDGTFLGLKLPAAG
ncbi:MAG: PQQ-binding-like beta-propeller repeat protein [Deltaproteobacteria bacterium]|nr:PQQ-binding-like beta-propeller repeat protein [Deltaproteobacteria bacterium]